MSVDASVKQVLTTKATEFRATRAVTTVFLEFIQVITSGDIFYQFLNDGGIHRVITGHQVFS